MGVRPAGELGHKGTARQRASVSGHAAGGESVVVAEQKDRAGARPIPDTKTSNGGSVVKAWREWWGVTVRVGSSGAFGMV